MRLIELKAENFKRLVAVHLRPGGAVTPITGKNGAGKTSVLDAITAALGGGSHSPDVPIRKGQERAAVVVDLGDLVVTRKWTPKGSSLEVASKDGAAYKSPQAVLDKLVGELSFDPLAFTRMPAKEQAATLAQAAGIDLDAHRANRQAVFESRSQVNKGIKELRAAISQLPEPPEGTPDEEVSVSGLLDELKAAEAVVRERDALARAVKTAQTDVAIRERRVDDLRNQLADAEVDLELARKSVAAAEAKLTAAPEPPDAEAIRQRGRAAEETNRRVRAKQLKAAKGREAAAKEDIARQLTEKLAVLDAELAAKLAAAALPIPGLSIAEAGVLLNGVPFAQCSGAEKLRASVAIGLALNPKLKLMLIRDGSLLDDEGMRLLAELAEAADAQVLIERVSNGDGVGVRIVDGAVEEEPAKAA